MENSNKKTGDDIDFIESYNPNNYNRPNTSVDLVILTIIDSSLHVLTVKRAEQPFKGGWALVGGFIDIDKDKKIEETAKRKLFDKTGITAPYLEQYGSIGDADRDPRYWSVTNVYFSLLHIDEINCLSVIDGCSVKWSKIIDNKISDNLAFDHNEILTMVLDRIRSKALYTTIPLHLMPETFILSELQNVYEIILDSTIEHKSFRRRIMSSGILEEVGKRKLESGRPAKEYRLKSGVDESLYFFKRNFEGLS